MWGCLTRFLRGTIGSLPPHAGAAICPNGSDASVNALAVSGMTIFAGGAFSNLQSRPRGHLVALSSLASFRGLPKLAAYCASRIVSFAMPISP